MMLYVSEDEASASWPPECLFRIMGVRFIGEEISAQSKQGELVFESKGESWFVNQDLKIKVMIYISHY
ncbi:hypothetical protein F8388_014982 [Cannabis sativa]|nr:hypothetical protein F8388_014982 [Cannabis sativa]